MDPHRHRRLLQRRVQRFLPPLQAGRRRFRVLRSCRPLEAELLFRSMLAFGCQIIPWRQQHQETRHNSFYTSALIPHTNSMRRWSTTWQARATGYPTIILSVSMIVALGFMEQHYLFGRPLRCRGLRAVPMISSIRADSRSHLHIVL